MTLLAFAGGDGAERRAAAAPGGRRCRSMSHASRAHSSKLAAAAYSVDRCDRQTDRRTDRHRTVRYIYAAVSSVNNCGSVLRPEGPRAEVGLMGMERQSASSTPARGSKGSAGPGRGRSPVC